VGVGDWFLQVKLPGPAYRQAGVPLGRDNVTSFHIVPLVPEHPARAGRGKFRSQTRITFIFFHKNKLILTEFPWLVKELEGIKEFLIPQILI
jgi:hypothetical protein